MKKPLTHPNTLPTKSDFYYLYLKDKLSFVDFIFRGLIE